jgi:hypothetical protein
MTPRRNANRLIALMWTLAGLLAWTAVGIRYFAEDTMNWPIAAAGLFCIALGLGAWTRRSTDAVGPADGRGRPPSA